MNKSFNVNGACFPTEHYMVDLDGRLKAIKSLVDSGKYFVINRARQYGKTTTLKMLGHYLKNEYVVLSFDFQKLSRSDFEEERFFVQALSREIIRKRTLAAQIPEDVSKEFYKYSSDKEGNFRLADLFNCFSIWCEKSEKPLVLIIDEIDSASNNLVFLDFLSQLRGCYIDRDEVPTFQSVILAGVYDIKNLRQKIRPEKNHHYNSPWNIAADFDIDMSFCPEDISGMLYAYEADHETGMDCTRIADLIYDYTSGYPFLVSRICKLTDEKVAGSERFPNKSAAWTRDGVTEAVKMLLTESNTLFESLTGKLADYPDLKKLLYSLLFTGNSIPYNRLNDSLKMAEMFGFIKNTDGNVMISNRIFETILYNLFLSEDALDNGMHRAGVLEKNQFIKDGHLDMDLVLKKFVVHFHELYGDQEERFLEDTGRKYFLLYLRPIINGVGNYYVESRTRNLERTDVIVDYRGEQFVIELKIWRGNAYNERGEKQLAEYLDYYHLQKGYMLSFNFNKKKEIGVKEIRFKGRVLVEAVV